MGIAAYLMQVSVAHHAFPRNFPAITWPPRLLQLCLCVCERLLQLWAITSPTRRPTFVDLGCGNGFLSHLLRAEG